MRSAILATVVLVAVAGWWFWPTEARRVRGRIDALVDTINEPPGEGVAQVAHAAHLTNFFTEDVVLDLGRSAGRIQGRPQLAALASRPTAAGHAFRLSVSEVSVDVDGNRHAVARLIAMLTTADDRTGEENLDTREVELQFRRTDDWRLSLITLKDTPERREP